MSDDELLADLLVRWEERYEQGLDTTPEELCPTDRPQLLPRLAAGIAGLKRVGWLVRRESPVGPNVRRTHASSRRSGDEPIPGYTLERLLGCGAFGEVWAASGPAPHSTVAIKFINGVDRTGPGVERCRIEYKGIERAKQIRHPFVLSLMRIDYGGGQLVVVGECCDSDLAHVFGARCEGRVETLKLCLGLLWDAAQGLDHLRDVHNLQHGDVKPTNLLVVADRCKVGDFGTVVPLGYPEPGEPTPAVLCTPGGTTVRYRTPAEVPWAVALRPGATLYTAHGGFTPRYAPPEAFCGRISRSSDQYSLALTFCELVYGRLPFSNEAVEAIERRRRGEFDLGFVYPPFVAAVARALSPDPASRFPSCTAFVERLLALLHS